MFGMGTGVALALWAPRTGFVRSSTTYLEADGTKTVLGDHTNGTDFEL